MLTAIDIPSKCCFDLIPVTLSHISSGKSARQLARSIGQHLRHAHFLLQNVRILGFVRKYGTKWTLTETGVKFMNAGAEERKRLLAQSIEASPLVVQLVAHSGSFDAAIGLTVEEISDFLVEHVVVSEFRRTNMQRVTANRRASSVKGWTMWLKEYLTGDQTVLRPSTRPSRAG